MSNYPNGVPLKKRRVNNDVKYGAAQDDPDIISIADDDSDEDDDDSSFSSSSMIDLKIPTQDTTEGESLSPPSPPFNTQPATIVTTSKKTFQSPTTATTKGKERKKRKVSMSPKDSLAKLPSTDSLGFRFTKASKSSAATNNKKKAAEDPTTKKRKNDANNKLQDEMALMDPSIKTKRKATLELFDTDDESDLEDLLAYGPRIPRKKPKGSAAEGLSKTNVLADSSNPASNNSRQEKELQPASKKTIEAVSKRINEEPNNTSKTVSMPTNATDKSSYVTNKALLETGVAVTKAVSVSKPSTVPTESSNTGTTKVKQGNESKSSGKEAKEVDKQAVKTKEATSKPSNAADKSSNSKTTKKSKKQEELQTATSEVKENEKQQPAKKKASVKSKAAATSKDRKKDSAGTAKTAQQKESDATKDAAIVDKQKTTTKGNDSTKTKTQGKTSSKGKEVPSKKLPKKAAHAKSGAKEKPSTLKKKKQSASSSVDKRKPAAAVAKEPKDSFIVQRSDKAGTATGEKEVQSSSSKKPANKAAPAKNGGIKSKGSGKQKTAVKASAAGTKPKPKKKRYDQRILQHMVTAMAPFSLRGLAQELDTTEQQLHHTLLAMKDKKLIFEKEFTSAKGRSKVLLWANLEAKETMKTEYSIEKAAEASQELHALVKQEKKLQQDLETTNALPSNTELTAKVESEEAIVSDLRQKLEDCKARISSAEGQRTDAPPPKANVRGFQSKLKSADQLARERCPRRLKIRINAMRGEWRNRMIKCKDFVDTLSDAMEKKPKDVRNLLDIETDEMVGVQVPAKHEV